jgi:subtilase family serine protease
VPHGVRLPVDSHIVVNAGSTRDDSEFGCGSTPAYDRRTVNAAAKPDLSVGLILTRDATERPRAESVGLLPWVAELTATITNIGDGVAGETLTRFWLHGSGVDRELRVVNTPELLPGDEIEVTALWDVRDGSGDYTVTVTADAFGQLDEARTDNNSASVLLRVKGTRVAQASLPG